MITYEYECSECNANFDVMQSIKDDPFTVCPECEQESLHRVLHSPLHVQIKGEPTTVGQLAERNAKRMSKEEMDMVQQRYKTAKTIDRIPDHLKPKTIENESLPEKPQWMKDGQTKTTKEVIAMTPEQTKKYVQEGK